MKFVLPLSMLKAFSNISVIAFFSLIAYTGYAQVKKGDTHEFKAVYDSTYGINVYEALNMNTGGDSTRNDAKGYALQGWMEDYYPDGKVLHKGYYIDGQLKAYKNFYPNGQVEREFKMMDLSRSGLNVFYDDGKTRSIITYVTAKAIKEEDYFNSGQMQYIEEYDKRCVYYLQRKFYSPSGKPTSTLELTDTKKMVYASKEYYDNGNIKEEGQLIFNESMGDYQKNGLWKFYNENGSIKEQKTFSKGDE
jgi:antitoxin component YwqK of YwqJK toxin-antitoxin module